jgi:hypothetical protein
MKTDQLQYSLPPKNREFGHFRRDSLAPEQGIFGEKTGKAIFGTGNFVPDHNPPLHTGSDSSERAPTLLSYVRFWG